MKRFFYISFINIKRKISPTKKLMDMLRRRVLEGIFLLFIVAGVSSCKVGKKYERPDLNLPTAIETDTKATSDTLPDWKSLYNDTILQGLIGIAVENNKDMLIAAAKIKEMMAAKRVSFANLLPVIDARVTAQKEGLNYGGDNKTFDPEINGKLLLSWELDFLGNLRWAHEADIAAYMQSVEARNALELTIIAEVAANYYELCALDRELEIIRQTLDARREGVRLAKLRYEGGLTSETSYQQAQVELARTETLVPDLEQQIKIKESDLSLLLGLYTQGIPRNSSFRSQDLPDSLPVGLPSSLLERRPDMRQAELKLREANARVGVANTNRFPKIRLTGNLGFENDEVAKLLASPAWFIAGDLLSPVFAMGKNKALYQAEKARYEQEVYDYQKSVLNAFKEVNNAIINVRKMKEIKTARARLEDAAQTYMQLAYLQYINGITNYIDVLDAQRGLFDAQIGRNDAELNEQLSIVSLYKALGGGYE